MTLAEGMHNKGHDLYVDRFYNSPILAVELGKVGITVTSTVQSNRKGLPESFRSKKEEPRGTVTGYRADDMLAFYWVDKSKVFVITTKHELSMVDVPPRYALLFSLWCAKQAAKWRLETRLCIHTCAPVYIAIQ